MYIPILTMIPNFGFRNEYMESSSFEFKIFPYLLDKICYLIANNSFAIKHL